MAIEQPQSGSKLESIGTVKTVVGTVKAVDPSGAERILQAGDRVFPNETIVTAEGGMVLVEFANGQTMDLVSGMSMVLDSSVFDPAAQATQADALTPEQIQEMIARGEDPTAITEASAAGAGAGDEGSSSFIQVNFNNTQGNVESGFDTQGIPGDDITPPEQLFIADEADGVASLSVTAITVIRGEDGQVRTFSGVIEDTQATINIGFVPADNEQITSVTLVGLPDGSSLEVNGVLLFPVEGTVTFAPLSGADVGAILFFPPENDDTDFTLGVTLNIVDPNSGLTAVLTTSSYIAVDAAADLPEIAVQTQEGEGPLVYNEDHGAGGMIKPKTKEGAESVYSTGFSASVTDRDGSESLTVVSITFADSNPEVRSLTLGSPDSESEGPLAHFMLNGNYIHEGEPISVEARSLDANGNDVFGLVEGIVAYDGQAMTITFDPAQRVQEVFLDGNFAGENPDEERRGTQLGVQLPSHADDDFDLNVAVTSYDWHGWDPEALAGDREVVDANGSPLLSNNTITSETLIHVNVQAVADRPYVSVTSQIVDEDGHVAPVIQAFFPDTDGSETHTITLTAPQGWALFGDLPAGWTPGAEVGTYNFTVSGGNFSGEVPTFTPPADSDVDGQFVVVATATETNSEGSISQLSASSIAATPVVVDAVADGPTVGITLPQTVATTITVANVGAQNSGFTVTAKNLDGSAGTVSTKTSGFPTGFGVSGNASGDSTEVGQANGQSEALVVKFDVPVTSATVQLAWLNPSEHAVYTAYDAQGNVIASGTRMGGSDGIEAPFTIAGADGAQISYIEFSTPAGGSNHDYLVNSITYQTAGIDEDGTVTPMVQATFRDYTDGSEVHTLTITPPAGWAVVEGSENGWVANQDGTYTYTVSAAQLIAGEGSISVPAPAFAAPANSDLDGTFTVVARAVETNLSGDEGTAGNNVATATTTIKVIVDAVADKPTVSIDGQTIDEDGSVTPTVSAIFPDADGSETHTLTITAPAGWTATTLNDWTSLGNGVYTMTVAGGTFSGNAPTFAAPANSDVDGVFTIEARAAETTTSGIEPDASDNIAVATGSTTVIVNAVADKPTITGGAVAGDEDNAVALNIGGAVTDTDGSEVLTGVFISGVANGALNVGQDLGNGNWFVAADQMDGLKFVPDANWFGTVTLTAQTQSFEQNTNGSEPDTGDNHALSDPLIFTVTVSGINDAPIIDLDGNEDALSGPVDYNYDTTFTENGAPVSIADTDVTITDVDDTHIESAVIVLTNAQAGDTLTVGTLPSGIAATQVGNTITLAGSATLADYQVAIKAITFANSSENPDATPRIIEVTVNDGDDNSNTAITTINVTPVNDNPVVDFAARGQGLEDSTDITVTLTATDVDGTVTSFVLGDTTGLNGTLYFNNAVVTTGAEITATNGTATLTFVPDVDESNNNRTFSFDYQAKDNEGGLSTPATATIAVAPVTDAPNVTLTVTPTVSVDTFALNVSNVLSGTTEQNTVGTPAGYTVTGYDQNGNVGTISTFSNGTVTGFGVVGEVAGNDSAYGVEASGAEKIVVELDTPATSVSYQLGFVRGSDKNGGLDKMEYVNITVHYSDGTSETRQISGDDTRALVNGVMKSDGVSPTFTANAPTGKTITSVEFQSDGNNINNDFLVHSVSYETSTPFHAIDITATPTDDDFSESITSLTVTTNEGVTLSGATLVGTQNGISTWSLSLNPANGEYTVSIDATTGKVEIHGLKMTVPNDFSGELTVTATATAIDPGASAATGTATWNDSNTAPTVTVTGAGDLVEGQAAAGEVVFTFTATDPESDALTLALIENSNGFLTLGNQPGTIVLTQAGADAVNANVPIESLTASVQAAETDTFEHLGDEASASIRVTAVNDAPETVNTSASGEDHTTIQVNLGGSDVDGTVAQFVITTLPANGTLYYNGAALALNDAVPTTGNAATITFVSNPGFDGQVTFQYHSVDNQGLPDATPATATISVDAADAPAVTVSVGEMTANNKTITLANAETTDQGFHITVNHLDGSAGTIGIRNVTSEQGFGINGGTSSGLSPEIGQNGLSGADYRSETMTVTFDNPVFLQSVSFSWLSSIEHAKYVLKDADGNVLGSNIVTGISDRIDPPVLINVDHVASIEFSAPGLSSAMGGINDDFLVNRIDFMAGVSSPVEITVKPSDIDHSESVVSVKVNVPEGAHLSGGAYVETVNGHDVWDIPLTGGNGYTVAVNETTGEVTITGLNLTVDYTDANNGYTVTATGTVEDAGGSTSSASATVYDSGANSITGTDGDDEYHGGLGSDDINGGTGNDIVDGGGDDDYLVGGIGNDILDGSAGMDVLWGGEGADKLMGGQGDDFLVGESGNDILTGGEGADMFMWQASDVGIPGAPAADVITDFNAAEGDTIYLSDVLTAGGGLTMSAVEAEDGHLQLQFSNSNSEVVQTIDMTSVAVNGADPTVLMNTLLAEGVISKD